MSLFRKSDFLQCRIVTHQFFFRKKTFLFVIRILRYSGYLTNTWCVCQVAGISKRSDNLYFLTPHVTNRDVLLLTTIRYVQGKFLENVTNVEEIFHVILIEKRVSKITIYNGPCPTCLCFKMRQMCYKLCCY